MGQGMGRGRKGQVSMGQEVAKTIKGQGRGIKLSQRNGRRELQTGHSCQGALPGRVIRRVVSSTASKDALHTSIALKLYNKALRSEE